MTPIKIHGLIQAVGNLVWLGWFLRLWYLYNFTSILFYYMMPDWIIALNVCLAIGGVYLSRQTFEGKAKPIIGYVYLILGVIAGFGIDILTN